MRDCFDWAFEEVMFSAAIWSSNQDPLHPKVTCITRLEHEVDGLRIPGTRWGIDNPDSIYRVIPISGDERYEIRGRVGAHRMTENYFTLWDDSMGTEGLLNGTTRCTEADGSFVVTVDADPAGGRPNHVQSTPKAHEFYIRDVMLDWGRDDPNWLEIVRLGPCAVDRRRSPTTSRRRRPPSTCAVRRLQPSSVKGMTSGRPNRFHLAYSADQGGALRNQVYVGGHFQLEDDEAFVIDVNDGGARYFTVPISNVWGTTMGIMDRTGSLNKAQSEPNADGTWTYVIARRPRRAQLGRPVGLPEGILTLRMAEFPDAAPDRDLSASGQVVKLADLDSVLPPAPRVNAGRAGRAARRRGRASYARRLPEVALP